MKREYYLFKLMCLLTQIDDELINWECEEEFDNKKDKLMHDVIEKTVDRLAEYIVKHG